MKKEIKIIIALGILVLCLLGYMIYDKYSELQIQKIDNATIQGANFGYTQAFIDIFQATNNCQYSIINVGNLTRQIGDIECLGGKMEFKFEVSADKEIIVEGFTDKEMARLWLIDNLEEECHDIINPSTYVSDGEKIV